MHAVQSSVMEKRGRALEAFWGVIAIIASLIGATSASADITTSLFPLPDATHAKSITAVPAGGIRFTGIDASDSRKAVVGQVATDGQVSVSPPPSKRPLAKVSERWLGETVAGSDGSLWFTEFFFYDAWRYGAERIGRIFPTGEFTEYVAGKHLDGVRSIATDPAGNLWFTATYRFYKKSHQAIGRITTSGDLTQFRLPRRSRPQGITAGPDGNMWFVESNPKRPAIGLVTPSGRIRHFPLPSKRRPLSIVAGPDGNLWFTERSSTYKHHASNMIGRISTSGALTEFPVPGKGYIEKIAAGASGRIWFTLTQGSTRVALGSITPAGAVTKPSCLEATCKLAPEALAVGADGTLWFAAGRRASSEGGGGSIIYENYLIEKEAGFVGKYSPPS
jgi:streptogramin lyase